MESRILARALSALLLCGCSSGPEADYRVPITLNHTLVTGEQVICSYRFIYIGLPFANKETAVIFFLRHDFTCEIKTKETHSE